MKREGHLKAYTSTLLAVSLFVACSCCSNKPTSVKNPPIPKSEALFDTFSYKGEDDYYKENPLQSAENFYNPILPGWYSDPSVCTNGKDYFLVTSTFVYYPGVPIFHSRDLVNWKQIGNVLNRPSQLVNMKGQHVSGGIYAPAIEYNPYNKTYYMITTNVGAGNFFVKTKDPFGEWSDPIFLPDVKGIDPSFFFDEDGKAYIVNNDDPEGTPEYDGHRAIRIQEFDVATDKTFGPRKVLIDKGVHPEDKPIWIEGPHLYKINGKYFLMAAEGGTSEWHSEVIFRSDSPMGKFEPCKRNPILTQRHLDSERLNPITCAGHADLIKTNEGEWWAVFLACRPINNRFENLGRETFMIPVHWGEDGFPYMTQGYERIPMVLKKNNVKREKNTTFGNFERTESFKTNKLSLEWMTLRGPADDLYSFTEVPGYLALKCANISASEKDVPAYVCRRMQHHKFECSTRMFFDPSGEKENAGMLLFKDERHQYFLAMGNGAKGRSIMLKQIGVSGTKVLAANKLDAQCKEVGLKVISKGTTYDFYYSTKSGNWTLLIDNVDANYLSTATAGGFTGTTIGLYATCK